MSDVKADLTLYRKLLLARLTEEAIKDDYFNDQMKTPVHLGIGAEAIAVGVSHCLAAGTQYFATYRNHNLYLSLSGDTDAFFAEMFGREGGCAKGKAGSMHLSCPEHGLVLTSAVVATTIPVAVGAAFAKRYKNRMGNSIGSEPESLVVVFFGDGAIEEGVFWESLNFASLKKLPVLFVCEDNELAIHSHRESRQGFRSLKDAITGFGSHYLQGEGHDVESVVSMTKTALRTMEEQPGPMFLHLSYFRFLQHVGPLEDFHEGYREKPAGVETEKDPVLIYEKSLRAQRVDAGAMQAVRNSVTNQIAASMQKARDDRFAGPNEILQDVYTELESTT